MASKLLSLLVTSSIEGKVVCHASGFFLMPLAVGQATSPSKSPELPFVMNQGATLNLLQEMARGDRLGDLGQLPILTVGHCLQPHNWQHLYNRPEDAWLDDLRAVEGFISTDVRLLDNDGESLGTWPAYPLLFHTSADLAAVSLLPRALSHEADTVPRRGRKSPVARFADALVRANKSGQDIDGVVQTEFGWFDDGDLESFASEEQQDEASKRLEVQMYGCKVLNSGLPNEWKHADKLSGHVKAMSRFQLFCGMEQPPAEGMCGGPVRNRNGQLVGMLEGLVNPLSEQHGLVADTPELRLRQRISGSAALIPQSVLQAFVKDAVLVE